MIIEKTRDIHVDFQVSVAGQYEVVQFTVVADSAEDADAVVYAFMVEDADAVVNVVEVCEHEQVYQKEVNQSQ